jgi:hypothetical protein
MIADIIHTAERSLSHHIAGQVLLLTAAAVTPTDDDPDALISAATVVELVRVYAMIRRRLVGEPAGESMEGSWDRNAALLAGDFVLAQAFVALGDVVAPAGQVTQCYRTLERGCVRVVEGLTGESGELSPTPRESVFTIAMTIGAILGNADADSTMALRDAGFALGTLSESGTGWDDSRENASHARAANAVSDRPAPSDSIERRRTALATLPATDAKLSLNRLSKPQSFQRVVSASSQTRERVEAVREEGASGHCARLRRR